MEETKWSGVVVKNCAELSTHRHGGEYGHASVVLRHNLLLTADAQLAGYLLVTLYDTSTGDIVCVDNVLCAAENIQNVHMAKLTDTKCIVCYTAGCDLRLYAHIIQVNDNNTFMVYNRNECGVTTECGHLSVTAMCENVAVVAYQNVDYSVDAISMPCKNCGHVDTEVSDRHHTLNLIALTIIDNDTIYSGESVEVDHHYCEHINIANITANRGIVVYSGHKSNVYTLLFKVLKASEDSLEYECVKVDTPVRCANVVSHDVKLVQRSTNKLIIAYRDDTNRHALCLQQLDIGTILPHRNLVYLNGPIITVPDAHYMATYGLTMITEDQGILVHTHAKTPDIVVRIIDVSADDIRIDTRFTRVCDHHTLLRHVGIACTSDDQCTVTAVKDTTLHRHIIVNADSPTEGSDTDDTLKVRAVDRDLAFNAIYAASYTDNRLPDATSYRESLRIIRAICEVVLNK